MAEFGVVSAERKRSLPSGATSTSRRGEVTQRPVAYVDYTVDGRRLVDLLSADGETYSSAVGDYVGGIEDEWPIEAVAAVKRLLGEEPGDLADGRVSLYVCPECGDLGCGAVTASLVIDQDEVTWQDIAFQHSYADDLNSLYDDGHLPSLTFDRASYETVLRGELSRLLPLCEGFEYPYQARRRERRRRLWRQLVGWLGGEGWKR